MSVKHPRLFDIEREIPEAEDPGSLADQDVILVNSSGGKDSQSMLDLIHERAAREGVLDRVVVVHADLGRVEWPGTREIAQAQAEAYGFRFITVSRPQGDLLIQIETQRKKFPGPDTRFCTSDQKTKQVHRVMTQLAAEWREAHPEEAKERTCRILNCLGMRADESDDRECMASLEDDLPASNKTRRTVTRWLPIHHWTLEMVWERIRNCRTSHLVHYCYALGMSRCSCVFCILASKSDLIIGGKHNPELLAEYERVQDAIQHLFKKDLSISQIASIVRASAG